MFIGRLDGERSPVLVKYKLRGKYPQREITLPPEANPFADARFFVDMAEYFDEPLRLCVSLSEECFVDTVSVRVACDGIRSLRVLRADGEGVLAEYHAETNHTIRRGEARLTVAERVRDFALEIASPFAHIELAGIGIYGAVTDENVVYPTPAESRFSDGRYEIASFGGISSVPAAAACAATVLTEKVKEVCGTELSRGEGRIFFAPDLSAGENGYRLKIGADGIFISAADERGFVSGAETVVKLLRDKTVPACEIADRPCMPFRGVHLYLPGYGQYDFAKRLIKYVISPMGYNTVILEIGAGMKFDSHPEINEATDHAKKMAAEGLWPTFPHADVGGREAVDKETVRDFAAYIRSFGIDIVPEVQSLGHVQTITVAHPELAEIPDGEEAQAKTDENAADIPPAKFYPHCYCPSLEEPYRIVFDLLDEIIEVIRPKKYVHMGHDEVYEIGVCKRCRGKDPAALYAQDVIRYHDYLKERGLGMMIWGDMLQPVTTYRTPAAIDRIPKDIVILDFIWYFHVDRDIEDNLLEKGFRVVLGNMYSSHYPRFRRRVSKDGVLGAQISMWCGTEEKRLGMNGKIYDMLYTAEMLWSADYDERLRYAYDAILSAMMPSLRDRLRGRTAPSHKSGARLLPFTGDRTCGMTPPRDGDGRFDSLIFTHATTREFMKPAYADSPSAGLKTGSYTVTYADGTTETIDADYGYSIGYRGTRQGTPTPYFYYRHVGYFFTYFTDARTEKSPDGSIRTYYSYEWENPHPEKPVLRVDYTDAAEVSEIDIRGIDGVVSREKS